MTIERVAAVRAAVAGEQPPCPTCGGVLRLVERARGRQVQGLTGDATIYRPTYVCSRAACGQVFAPLDAELGLGATTLTPRLARVACRAGITEAFDALPSGSTGLTGTFGPDNRTITGRWELSDDGSQWSHDFDLIYTKDR